MNCTGRLRIRRQAQYTTRPKRPTGENRTSKKTGSSFLFLSCEGHSYSLNSWAPLHVPFPRKGSHGINSDSLGFNSTVLPLRLCCRILNSAPRESCTACGPDPTAPTTPCCHQRVILVWPWPTDSVRAETTRYLT